MKQPIKASLAGVTAALLLTTVTAFTADASAATTRYEAETAPAQCQGTIDSDHAGYSGSGFCNGDSAAGAYAQFTVTAADAATATLRIRFANGASSGAARPANLIVNGTTVGTVSFESTGSWSTWSTKTVTASLNAGSNTVRLDPTADAGLPNIDYLEWADDSEPPGDGRQMENLGRGVVAVRSDSDSV
ncbi:carbohydrate-binding protein, partial [Streptomyces synnematoformans]|uniref:carbohydrate-binding protein n=1 Tax=Streptomyces synnematoformans TaxID=415721 RepID=UPI0031E056CF